MTTTQEYLVKNLGLAGYVQTPAEDELCSIYGEYPLIPRVDAIIMGYKKKIDLLTKF